MMLACLAPVQANDLDAAIQKNRTGTLIIQTRPGAKIEVEQLRHEFWFGSNVPTVIFNGEASPADVVRFKEIFVRNYNAGVIAAALKWHEMERERGW